jgi:Lysophospholipase L1 and related esterases
MKRLLLLAILLFTVWSCSFTADCSDAQDTSCTRVLFIGNSYTFVNDLPNTFAKLAGSGGHNVEVGMSAQGGWRLADHAVSIETLHLLNSTKWNFVVLQEQSQIPAITQVRNQEMYPAARELVQKIKNIEATPIFFITWAHRDGMPANGMTNYESMQTQINDGYMGLAQELNTLFAPVGSAWLAVVKQHREVNLWQEDGSHPTEQGTYLAACVFYAVIFHESPDGLTYHSGVSKENAKIIQTIASDTVLNIP